MKLKILFITIALLMGIGSSYGQLLQWNTFGNTGTETIEPSVFNGPNILASELTKGSITAAVNENRFGGSNWFNSGNTFAGNTLEEAVAGNDYIQFIVSPNSGFSFTPTSFVFSWDRSGTGPRNVTLRSSVDAFATDLGTVSGLAEAITTGNTITISGLTNITTPITFRIYGYGATVTGGTGGFDIESNEVNVQLNGTTASTGPYSIASGDWNVGSTWNTGLVPSNTDNVTISANHIVHTTTPLTRTGATTVNGTFELRNSGFASGTNFNYNNLTGSLHFNTIGNYVVDDNHVYWPVTIGPRNVHVLQGGMRLNTNANRVVEGEFSTALSGTWGIQMTGATLTLNGTCMINGSGFFANSPIFGSNSTLIYNSGGTFDRGNEWQALGVGTIGTTPGYPNNVQLSNNTTLNYNNGTPLAKAINGNLIIGVGSHFNMSIGGASGGTLTVAGNITNTGSLTLGNTIGDDLLLGGNFTQTGAGTFNGNNRAIFFTRNGTQTVASVTPLTIPYVVFAPTTGSTTVQLLSNLTISAPGGGNAISFSSETDVLDINSQNLIIGTTGVANTIFGLGTFRGTTTSNLTLLGTGSIGTLRFTTGQQILGDLNLNRQSSVIGFELGTTLSINGILSLTNGLIQLNNQTMIFTTNGSVSGNNASNYVIADFDLGGKIQKNINNSSLGFTFPIGDDFGSADGSQYAPASINFTGGTFSGASVSVSVRDVKHPNMDSTSNYISRYWVVTRSGSFTDPVYNFTGTYLPMDIVGTEGNSSSQQWDGSVWSVSGTNLLSGTTMTMNGITELPSTNHFTAGLRTPEIRVERSTNAEIPSGSVPSAGFDTVFAAQNIGNSGTKTYRIVNIGTANLNVSSITLGGLNPENFSINASTPFVIIPGSFVTFTVTFAPLNSGVLTAQVIIANNDVNESSYTFGVQGTGNCNASNTITPASGPVGTEITINATTNNLNSASVSFNGIPAASVTQISSTQIKATVPIGATSGVIITTNSSGCSVSNPFTVIDNFTSGCEGGAAGTELFISEVTDATTGGLTYIEIFNPTTNPIQLNEYSIRIFSNGLTTSTTHNLNNFLLNPGDVYVFAVGVSSNPSSTNTCSIDGGNGQLANQTTTLAGINFVDGSNQSLGHDHIALFKNSIKIDSWGVYENESWATSLDLGTRGANFRRRNDVVAPNTTYSNADWEIFDWEGEGQTSCFTNDYSDIGSYSFLAGNPPTVTTQPIYSPSCRSTVLSVTSIEGFSGGNALAYQWYMVAPNQSAWSVLVDNAIYSGVTTNTLTISDIIGLDGYQYYCQVMENTATCYVATNAVKLLEPQTTTWNGVWTPATPNSSTKAIFASNYTTTASGNIEACECLINSNVDVIINSGDYFEIQSKVTVNGTLTIENNGSLVQVENVVNEGAIDYIREADNVNIYDYVYWSSPVAGFSLANVTGTANRYRWLTIAPNSNGGLGNWSGYSGTMELAKGYIVRVPNTFPEASSSGNTIETIFSGEPNNGTINVNILRGNMTESTVPSFYTNQGLSKFDDNWNLVGNPYPSALNVELFLQHNAVDFPVIEGAVRLWTHGSPPSSSNANPFYGTYTYNYSPNDYIVHNGLGTISGPEEFNGNIATGQGFFVLMNEGEAATDQLSFTNAMRSKNYNNSEFFRFSPDTFTETEQKHRIWLDIIASNGVATRTLVGYIPNATVAKDVLYDAYTKPGTLLNIYSLIANETLCIQGRPTPFEVTDQVPLGIVTPQNDSYTIAIHTVDGLFSNGGQTIYLEDTLLNQIHNLSMTPYVFNSTVGKFDTRFILRYTNETLSTPELTIDNQLWVYVSDGIHIQSQLEGMEQVTVYDLLGKRLYEGNANQLLTHKITQIHPNKQVLFVRVTLSNGSVVTKKVVY